MLTYILIALAAILALLVISIAMRPAEFRITRSTTVSASPAAVFREVNDFHNWRAWSPWEKIDPELRRTYDGPVSGVGASYAWEGNSKVGHGRMTITDSRPDELVRIKLEFLKPFKCTNTAEFTFKPVDDQTAVTWTMTGVNGFISKAIHMVANMDKMIGSQFEEGLAKLKSIAQQTCADSRATTVTASFIRP